MINFAWITTLYSTDPYESDLTRKHYMKIKKSKRSFIYKKNDNFLIVSIKNL